MQNEIIVGKGTSSELENLHGKVTKVYSKAIDSLCKQISYADEQEAKYLTDVKLAEEAGEATEDIIKPAKYTIDKDDLALLKNAQSFLKENDVQMDIVKGAVGGKRLRRNIAEQIAEKLKYN